MSVITERNIRNIFVYVTPRFISYGLNLAMLPILTRMLTPADFGIVTLAMVSPAIVVSIVTGGLTASVPRYFFEYRKDEKKLNMLYFSIQVYMYSILIVTAAAIYLTKDKISILVMGKVGFGMPFFIAYLVNYTAQINLIYLRIYQNMEKAILHSSFVLLQTITSVAMSIVLVWCFRMSYMGMLYGSLIGASMACLVMCIHFNRHVKLLFNKKILLENIKYGIQVIPKSFTGFINNIFDKFMLNAMLSIATVGVYGIGQKIANMLTVFIDIVYTSFHPLLYRQVFDRENEASRNLGRIFTIFSYIALIPVILAILFVHELFSILFPPSYDGAIDIIVILAAGVSIQIFGVYSSVQYAYTKRHFWIFPITVVGTVCNVGLNILLIPRYGLIGAGIATLISTFVLNIIFGYVGQKLYRIQYEWKTIIAMLININIAMIVILYLKKMGITDISLYLTKTVFLMVFVLIGIKSKIITRHSIGKVCNAIFRQSKNLETTFQ